MTNKNATQERPIRRPLASAALFLILLAACLAASPPAAYAQAPGHPLTQPTEPLPAENPFTAVRWSPHIVGVGIGILSWLAFLVSDHPLGVSTAYARTSGLIGSCFLGNKVKENAYYKKFVPKVDWEWMLVLGLFFGALVSAALSGDFHIEWVPPMWAGAFGASPVVRWLVALAGGFLVGVGSRWAGGCTSGHGISGTLQMVVSSWVALACFFAAGVITAFVLYHVIG